jgi:hypothetical protein
MNRNIFVKNKNDSNKFNPDVLKKYSDVNKNRNATKYDFLNKPYKMIINDNIPESVHSQADLKVDTSSNNININDNFKNLVNDRKYLDNSNKDKYNDTNFNQNKSKFDFRTYQVSKISTESTDFNELKTQKKSYYTKEKNNLLKEKSKYNDIMQNLKTQGII